MSHIYWILDKTRIDNQNKANIQSAATAQLANLLLNVAHAFSGSKGGGPKTRPQDFLPFPRLEEELLSERGDGPDEFTKLILKELLKTRKLPMYIYSLLSDPAPRRP